MFKNNNKISRTTSMITFRWFVFILFSSVSIVSQVELSINTISATTVGKKVTNTKKEYIQCKRQSRMLYRLLNRFNIWKGQIIVTWATWYFKQISSFVQVPRFQLQNSVMNDTEFKQRQHCAAAQVWGLYREEVYQELTYITTLDILYTQSSVPLINENKSQFFHLETKIGMSHALVIQTYCQPR